MSETRNERIAGAYAFRQIYNIVNEIGAASNPATPTEIAGRVYKRLHDFVEFVEDFIPEDAEELTPEEKSFLRKNAIDYLRSVYESLSRAPDLNDQERDWLRSVKIVRDMMEDVLAGKFPERDATNNDDQEANDPSQRPDDPSWHGPE